MNKKTKKVFFTLYYIFNYFFFDPLNALNRWKSVPFYIKNLFLYKKEKDNKFPLTKEIYPCTQDKFAEAGETKGHYFFQDLWVAQKIHKNKPQKHVDCGSRIDGFISHLLVFRDVELVDLRPINNKINNLNFVKGDITNLPYNDNELESFSCLHTIEHIGLGRYGDKIDKKGYYNAAKEMERVIKPGGYLYLSTPIGQERLVFDAHRIFNPQTIIDLFPSMELVDFAAVNDNRDFVYPSKPKDFIEAYYSCGIFVFRKKDENDK